MSTTITEIPEFPLGKIEALGERGASFYTASSDRLTGARVSTRVDRYDVDYGDGVEPTIDSHTHYHGRPHVSAYKLDNGVSVSVGNTHVYLSDEIAIAEVVDDLIRELTALREEVAS